MTVTWITSIPQLLESHSVPLSCLPFSFPISLDFTKLKLNTTIEFLSTVCISVTSYYLSTYYNSEQYYITIVLLCSSWCTISLTIGVDSLQYHIQSWLFYASCKITPILLQILVFKLSFSFVVLNLHCYVLCPFWVFNTICISVFTFLSFRAVHHLDYLSFLL